MEKVTVQTNLYTLREYYFYRNILEVIIMAGPKKPLPKFKQANGLGSNWGTRTAIGRQIQVTRFAPTTKSFTGVSSGVKTVVTKTGATMTIKSADGKKLSPEAIAKLNAAAKTILEKRPLARKK